jgi:hypothetical protein
VLLFLTIAAYAQTPVGPTEPTSDPPLGSSASSQCADATEGTEVEVCLRLAASHPGEVNGIAAALRAHVDRATAPDRTLLLALLKLMSEETGVEGASDLGELADPRAVAPLTHAVETRREEVAQAAVKAVARYSQGREALHGWLLDPNARLAVREASAEAFGTLGDEAAGDALVDSLRQPGLDRALRLTIVDIVLSKWPERADQIIEPVSRAGAAVLGVGGAAGLGFAMGTVGHFGQTDLSALGVVTGAVGGGTAGYIIGRAWPIQPEDAAFITAAGIDGMAAGSIVGMAMTADSPEPMDGFWIGGLTTGAVAYGTAAVLHKGHSGTSGDVMESQVVAATAAMLGGGSVQFAHNLTGHGDAMMGTGIGMAAGMVAGLVVAPKIDLSRADVGAVALGGAYGGAFGALLPLSSVSRGGFPTATTAAGALTAYAVSGPAPTAWDGIAGGASGMVIGGTFGAGLGLLIAPENPDVVSGVALLGATGGLAGGAASTLMDDQPIDDRDVVLASLASAFGAWQSVGWAVHYDAGPRAWGAALMVPSLVGGGISLAARDIDWPVTNAAGAVSIGLWGGYVGGSVALLLDKPLLPSALIASNAMVVGGGFLMSPWVGTPPLVVGIADAGGVLGGAMGGLLVSFSSTDPDSIIIGSLVGAGVGFAGGAVGGTVLHRSGAAKTIAWHPGPVRVLVSPASFAGRSGQVYGARLAVSGW